VTAGQELVDDLMKEDADTAQAGAGGEDLSMRCGTTRLNGRAPLSVVD
jgi:hypothetical protein